MKKKLLYSALILIAVLIGFALMFSPPSNEEMKHKANAIRYASTVKQYYIKYGKYPDSIMKAYVDLWGDERYIMGEFKLLPELGEFTEFNNKGGFVYSPEKKYVQINQNAYKHIKIEIHINPDDLEAHEIYDFIWAKLPERTAVKLWVSYLMHQNNVSIYGLIDETVQNEIISDLSKSTRWNPMVIRFYNERKWIQDGDNRVRGKEEIIRTAKIPYGSKETLY